MISGQDRLIHFVCVARSHLRSGELGLTRHFDRWALCPDLIGRDHEWQETGGLEVRDAVARWHELVGIDRPAA